MNAAAGRPNAIFLGPISSAAAGQEPHLSRLSEHNGDDIIVEKQRVEEQPFLSDQVSILYKHSIATSRGIRKKGQCSMMFAA